MPWGWARMMGSRGICKVWEGAQPRVHQPASEEVRGASGLMRRAEDSAEASVSTGPAMERCLRCRLFSAKTGAVPGKPKWLITVAGLILGSGFQCYPFQTV